MKDWFTSLESREQQFVSVGAIVVLIAIIYGFVWVPFERSHAELRTQVQLWKGSIAQLRPLRAMASRSAGGGTATNSGAARGQRSPLIVVDETLQARGLDRYRRNSQPTSSNGIRIVFEDVAFDELIVWLGDLSEQHGMDVQNGSFSTGSSEIIGRINATLTLERSP